jgi:hypothetical protein
MRVVILVLWLGALGCTDTGGSSSSSGSGGADDAGMEDAGPLLVDVPTTTCVSGKQWVGGTRKSPLMRPGSNCMTCHGVTTGAPTFLFAGTVYTSLHEPNDCTGLANAKVRVTDNDGISYDAVTNEVGNFYVYADGGVLATPYRATIFAPDGGIQGMVSPQEDHACNGCHNAVGSPNSAPGRLLPR